MFCDFPRCRTNPLAGSYYFTYCHQFSVSLYVYSFFFKITWSTTFKTPFTTSTNVVNHVQYYIYPVYQRGQPRSITRLPRLITWSTTLITPFTTSTNVVNALQDVVNHVYDGGCGVFIVHHL
jgi:hypothetical protein